MNSSYQFIIIVNNNARKRFTHIGATEAFRTLYINFLPADLENYTRPSIAMLVNNKDTKTRSRCQASAK